MPLPANSSISLQGHSRPGEGVTTMPKIAMVVRMTEETLDALQNLSAADRMDFEFGDKPGIFVRDQFFSMRYDKEKDNQELFIRTTMAARPNAPLKLNANVVGKFAVEPIFSDKISQRLHNATAAAAKQKAERKTIMLDSPLVMPAVPQKSAPKRKAPPKSATKSTPTIVKSYATPVPSQTSSATASTSVSLPKELVTIYRQRLVHYLALGGASVQDIFKEFGGSEIDQNTRSSITELLNEVAEQEQVSRKIASSSQVTKWQLKPRTWLEVRPYQYQSYTDNVRTKVARTARTWLGSLRIPESDPAWDHVKFRDSGHGGATSNVNSAQRAVNGTSSAAAKAKAKAKEAKAKEIEMKAKSEAAPPARTIPLPTSLPPRPNPHPDRETSTAHSTKGKGRDADAEKEEGELSASQTPPRLSAATANRRLPGSRSNDALTPTMHSIPVPPPSQPLPSSQTPSSVSSKRTGPVDPRGPRRIPPTPSERARAAPPIPPPVPVERKVVVQAKKETVQPKKERASLLGDNVISASGSSIQSAKEREPGRRERDRESDRESVRMARKERHRESDRESVRGHDRDRAPKDKGQGREREVEQERPREKVKEREQHSSRPVIKSSAKRKASGSSDEESSDWGYEDRQSMRKSTSTSASANTTKLKRDRESVSSKALASSLKVPKRESTPPKRIKREPSPLPPSKTRPLIDRKAVAGASSSVSKAAKKEAKVEALSRPSTAKSLKRRRSSIDFTSSSEEEEERPKPKGSKSAAKALVSSHLLAPKPAAVSASATPVARARQVKPLPTLSKHERLRSRYSNTYSEYLIVFQKLFVQKTKFEALLRSGSESPSGDSDGDVDMMPLDEVEELTARYQRLHDELEDIKKHYMAPPGVRFLHFLSDHLGVVSLDDAQCSTTSHSSSTVFATTSPQATKHPAQTPPASVQVGVQASRPLLLMGFTLGSLAVMSGFRPFEPSSFSKISALFELRSMLLSVVVFLVLLVLAYLTNPSETSFRAFLTEQAFRHHLSRLDDADAQDELESPSSATKPDAVSRRGLSNSFKHRALNAYSSAPFAFATRASVSLRTPKHIFRSFGILSVAAVVPTSSSNRSSSTRTQRGDEIATRSDKNGGSSTSSSLISDTWFIGAFGMWFWAANLDGFWGDAGLVTKDEADGTITGVLEIKALDRSDESNRTSYSANGNGSTNHSQRPSPKLRSRERFAYQNGNALSHRSQTPPPLPKTASLPLHTKRGSHPSTSDKPSSGLNHHLGDSFTVSSAPSPIVQLPLSITPEFRSINASSLPVLASSNSPSTSPSRSSSALFASSPLITEILRQLSTSQNAISDLRSQVSDFDSSSAQARAALDNELERQRERKRADDAAKAELKALTKALEDQKRTAEAARRDAEKRLKAARSEKDSADTRSDRFEHEICKLHSQMESHGAAIVASGVEASALAADLEEQVEAKRSEIRSVEEEVAKLGLHLREMEEKVADEERRLESAIADAKERKLKATHTRLQVQNRLQNDNSFLPIAFASEDKFGAMKALPQLQARRPENNSIEKVEAFPSSPFNRSMPDSPPAAAPHEAQVHHVSAPAPPIPTSLNPSLANGFSMFNSDLSARHAVRNPLTHTFAPFSSDLTSPGPLSPTGESLIPSSLYESLGMAVSSSSHDLPVSSADMDVSRSFQSEDDIILDRNWLNHRNRSAGDVGQPLAFPSPSTGSNTSPVSPTGSTNESDTFETGRPARERVSSLRMNTQRAAFPSKFSVTDFTSPPTLVNNTPSAVTDHVESTSCTPTRRSGWFASHKNKGAMAQEKKGLNPDAKEFSLSKDKERSFSALLSRSRGSGYGSSSGTPSTPSTASLSTPEPTSLVNSPSSISVSAVKSSSPQIQTTPPARTAGSLLSLGSSWFGSSRAFAPTPLEREQLSRALGGTANSSLDKLDRLPSLPTSPQPKPALVHAHTTSGLQPRPWDIGVAFELGTNCSKGSSGFCPFEDEVPAASLHSGSSSPSDESIDTSKEGATGTVDRA